GCSRFARHYSGNRTGPKKAVLFWAPICFPLLGVLRCFSSPGLPQHALWVQAAVPAVSRWWVAPFGNPRIKACLRLPEAISVFAPSFIGSWRQGIHRVPFVTSPQLLR